MSGGGGGSSGGGGGGGGGGGSGGEITPDLVEWIITDEKVSHFLTLCCSCCSYIGR